MPKNKKNSKSYKTAFLSFLGLVLVAAGTFGALVWINEDNRPDEDSNRSADRNTAVINEENPDKDDPDKYSYGDDLKKEGDEEDESNKENEDGRIVAEIFIGYAEDEDNSIIAGAEAFNIVEETGICTYVFTSPSGTQKEVSVGTLPSAKSTPCESASIEKSETGSWKVMVKYDSTTAVGESTEFSFTVK